MRRRRHSFESLLVLLVFCVYAAGSLFLCALGASTYQDIASSREVDYSLRTGVLYLAEKTRQSDVADAVRVEAVDGEDALVLTEQISGLGYESWIFVYDGNLCEMLVEPGTDVHALIDQRQVIMPMAAMSLEFVDASLLRIVLVTPQGDLSSIALEIKSSGAALPASVFGGDK